jgi:hypothetical protein
MATGLCPNPPRRWIVSIKIIEWLSKKLQLRVRSTIIRLFARRLRGWIPPPLIADEYGPAPGANATPPGAERSLGGVFPGEPSPRNRRDIIYADQDQAFDVSHTTARFLKISAFFLTTTSIFWTNQRSVK